MSTRGAFGIRIGGVDKIAYNHSDSYPSGLGSDLLDDFRSIKKEKGIDWIIAKATKLRVVDSESKPTPADVKSLERWTNLEVSNKSTEDWYCLTRGCQGDLFETLKAGVILDSHKFLADSLFCEYAYIINFDDGVFEMYRGFQKKPGCGRYAKLQRPPYPNQTEPTEYFGVSIKKKWRLSELPKELKG